MTMNAAASQIAACRNVQNLPIMQFPAWLENPREFCCINRLQKGNVIMTIYGYARVSTDGQSLVSQESELKAAGCAKVFAEKVSGARGDRAELAKALKRLEGGDTLVVTRLDRARSTRDLLNILHRLSQNDVSFRSLHDVWADTTSAHGRLMLTVLGGLAEFERELILVRTNDGRKRAVARGVRFGRPHKLTAHQRQEALARLANGETQADIARSYAVNPTTIGRLT
jgi:DNA invertase Pin-like site-specific DNA recombinase